MDANTLELLDCYRARLVNELGCPWTVQRDDQDVAILLDAILLKKKNR
jgi:hypothetical protein